MKNVAVDLWLIRFICSLDSVLENSSPGTGERICNDGCGDKMIRMENEYVLRVINDALAPFVKDT